MLLVGVEELQARIDSLHEEHGDDWNGYLLPSLSSGSIQISTTARRHFRDLADEARITIYRMAPIAKIECRYWYTAYKVVVKRGAERFEDIAKEQGSNLAEIVLDNYLSKPEWHRHH